MGIIANLQARARALKRETYALYRACRDPRVPWPARVLAIAAVAYAFSPIDLIPDFIPVLGYLDDLLLVPLLIGLALRLIPAEVMDEHHAQVDELMAAGKPVNWGAAAIIIAVWVGLVGLCVWLVWRAVAKHA
jgi:uncharacterized membrane protein YkvA (DUF1232 family)